MPDAAAQPLGPELASRSIDLFPAQPLQETSASTGLAPVLSEFRGKPLIMCVPVATLATGTHNF